MMAEMKAAPAAEKALCPNPKSPSEKALEDWSGGEDSSSPFSLDIESDMDDMFPSISTLAAAALIHEGRLGLVPTIDKAPSYPKTFMQSSTEKLKFKHFFLLETLKRESAEQSGWGTNELRWSETRDRKEAF